MAFTKKKEDNLRVSLWRSTTNPKELCLYVVNKKYPSQALMRTVKAAALPRGVECENAWTHIEEMKKLANAQKAGE